MQIGIFLNILSTYLQKTYESKYPTVSEKLDFV
jgi:hypothetical protein